MKEVTSSHKDKMYKFAYTLSRLFEPIITNALIGLLFIMIVDVSIGWLTIVLLGNMFIPLSFLFVSVKRGWISDADITKRKERIPYYVVMAVCWSLTLIVLWVIKTAVPREILMMQTWLVILGLLNVGITYFWKISGHILVATSLVLWLTLLIHPAFIVLLFTFIPLLAWARWYMKKHTVAQLIVACLLMLVVVPTVWSLYQTGQWRFSNTSLVGAVREPPLHETEI